MRDTAPTKYQVRVIVPGRSYTPASWNCRRYGRPTGTNLRKYVERFEASTRPGGVNAHLGIETVASALILLNDGSGTIVTEYIREVTSGTDMFTLLTEIV